MNNIKISRLLIANRGEIARRIAQSAKKLKIHPVVILCDDEKIPLYLHDLVSDFYREAEFGAKVFLNCEQLIQIAKKCSATQFIRALDFSRRMLSLLLRS
jgi:acetyl/propionyl-CoA carboxylase alpha subunit